MNEQSFQSIKEHINSDQGMIHYDVWSPINIIIMFYFFLILNNFSFIFETDNINENG